jgi:fatty acid-binding protein DegV
MQFGTMNFKDVRDPDQTMEFYRRYVAEKELEITTAPLSVKAIKDWFLDQLVLKYDRVLVITVSSSRSPRIATCCPNAAMRSGSQVLAHRTILPKRSPSAGSNSLSMTSST